MSIMRITVRTFQNEQHAEMFIAMAQKIMEDALKDEFKINFTIYDFVSCSWIHSNRSKFFQ